MFQWLARLFGRRSRRDIFEFFDGEKRRRIDPLAVLRQLNANPTFSDNLRLLHAAKDEDQFTAAANAEVLAAIRAAFGVQPVGDTGGLTETETAQLFDDFWAFVEDLKKKSPRWQNLRATTPAPSTSVQPPATTPPTSGSGSIAIESDFIEHCPCAGESGQQ